MKLQACTFIRSSVYDTAQSTGAKLKSDFAPFWETGVAVLENFNDGSVSYIIDEAGKKVSYPEMYDWRLSTNLGFSAIDTKFDHVVL